MRRSGLAMFLAGAVAATSAFAAEAPDGTVSTAAAAGMRIPAQLDAAQVTSYRQVFAAIRDKRWTDAQIALDAMTPGPLHTIARAELYTAKGSPKVEADRIVALLTEAPELPEADALARLAKTRGALDLPPLPQAQPLVWQDGAPRRARAKSVRADAIAADLSVKMQPFIKADDGRSAQALLESTPDLTPEATTEWQQKVAWIYYVAGDDANARTMAAKAAEGTGNWALQARWAGALAAWRQHDCAAAGTGFEGVAARAADTDLRAAGLYWAARADMVCGRPDRIEARLKNAAQYAESFYGQLARQALAMRDAVKPATGLVAADWSALGRRPNIRVAAALVEVGETDLADSVVRQQARIGTAAEFAGLVRVAAALDLPATSIWLAHNCPSGVTALAEARYPMPSWTPDSGWRVDRDLVFAHTLEESSFRTAAASRAGAYGLMQIVPAAASDYARERGLVVDRTSLTRPQTNIDVGQRHLERLRDMTGITGGLLPKVIAAYNAGPRPVGQWNASARDGGDPLLYIESIPYWETRGYVTTVLRNYWVYEAQGGRAKLASRAALAQGLWPRFPGLAGATGVRIVTPVPAYVPPAAPVVVPVTAIAASAQLGTASPSVTRAD